MTKSHLDGFDITLLVASILVSAIIGLYFSNKNNSLESFMLGDRKSPMLPVAVSLMTSCLSTLTLLGASAELFYQGVTYSFTALALMLCGPITAYTMLPVFHRMNELSLYKYLEVRFGPSVKVFASGVFILHMIFYNSLVLYLPSLALQSIIGISRFHSTISVGMICVMYSTFGGLKAVIWTDLFQGILMYASVIVVIVVGTLDAGGVAQVLKNASDGGRLSLDGFFNMDLTTRHTLWGMLIGSTIKHIYIVGVNQIQIQRALSLPTLKQGQMSFVWCSFFAATVSLLSSFMGCVLYSAYRSCDPYLGGEISRRDSVIVHYVARRLGSIPGMRGLFVAGMFSATLSTLSSFANSMSALALEDFIRPARAKLGLKDMTLETTTVVAKTLSAVMGLLCVWCAYEVDKANSRILQASSTMFGAVGAPLLAVFALGIFTRFCNTVGALVALATSLTVGIYIGVHQTFFASPLEPTMLVHFDEECKQVFNMTKRPEDVSWEKNYQTQSTYLKSILATGQPLSIDTISYISLPALQFLLTVVIGVLVSLATRRWDSPVVDDDHLIYEPKSKSKPRNLDFADRNPSDHMAQVAISAAAAAARHRSAASSNENDQSSSQFESVIDSVKWRRKLNRKSSKIEVDD